MKIFKKRFKNKEKEADQQFNNFFEEFKKANSEYRNQHENEIQKQHDSAAALGKLPAPDIIADYDCECGSKNSFHLKKMNLEHGHNVHCQHCGAVLHVPPTILDHEEYWEGYGGASLVSNWRDQLKFIEHGIHTSIIESDKSRETQVEEQKKKLEPQFATWRTIRIGNYDNVGALIKALKRAGVPIQKFIKSDLDSPAFSLALEEQEVNLIAASLEELGFSKIPGVMRFFDASKS